MLAPGWLLAVRSTGGRGHAASGAGRRSASSPAGTGADPARGVWDPAEDSPGPADGPVPSVVGLLSSPAARFGALSPSPGTPGEGRGEGSVSLYLLASNFTRTSTNPYTAPISASCWRNVMPP